MALIEAVLKELRKVFAIDRSLFNVRMKELCDPEVGISEFSSPGDQVASHDIEDLAGCMLNLIEQIGLPPGVHPSQFTREAMEGYFSTRWCTVPPGWSGKMEMQYNLYSTYHRIIRRVKAGDLSDVIMNLVRPPVC